MSEPVFRFGGIQRLYGDKEFQRLRATRFAVVGIGGVGSWAVESLARCGAGTLILVDYDDICVSNSNRQIHTTSSTVGQMKVSAMARRVRDINPDCETVELPFRFDADHVEELFAARPEAVIDASDGFIQKCLLISECLKRGVKVVTVGGSGGRADPTQIRAADLSRSHGDRLLAKVRKTLRTRYGFDRNPKKSMNVPTVFSAEIPRFPTGDGCVTDAPADRRNKPLDCGNGLGTASFVTGTFGFFAAHLAVQSVLADTAPAEPR